MSLSYEDFKQSVLESVLNEAKDPERAMFKLYRKDPSLFIAKEPIFIYKEVFGGFVYATSDRSDAFVTEVIKKFKLESERKGYILIKLPSNETPESLIEKIAKFYNEEYTGPKVQKFFDPHAESFASLAASKSGNRGPKAPGR
jgi:hypothetical protein